MWLPSSLVALGQLLSLWALLFSFVEDWGSEQVEETKLGVFQVSLHVSAAHPSQRDGEGIEMGREGFREKRLLKAEQGLPVRLGGIRMGGISHPTDGQTQAFWLSPESCGLGGGAVTLLLGPSLCPSSNLELFILFTPECSPGLAWGLSWVYRATEVSDLRPPGLCD